MRQITSRLVVVMAIAVHGCGPTNPPSEMNVTLSAVGAEAPVCGEGDSCSEGLQCARLLVTAGMESRCLSGDPCEALECGAELTCLAYLSSPLIYRCVRVVE